jgi:hypothetical protein
MVLRIKFHQATFESLLFKLKLYYFPNYSGRVQWRTANLCSHGIVLQLQIQTFREEFNGNFSQFIG